LPSLACDGLRGAWTGHSAAGIFPKDHNRIFRYRSLREFFAQISVGGALGYLMGRWPSFHWVAIGLRKRQRAGGKRRSYVMRTFVQVVARLVAAVITLPAALFWGSTCAARRAGEQIATAVKTGALRSFRRACLMDGNMKTSSQASASRAPKRRGARVPRSDPSCPRSTYRVPAVTAIGINSAICRSSAAVPRLGLCGA